MEQVTKIKSIFDDEFYMRKCMPPFHDGFDGYHKKPRTIVFFYALTPTGRLSKYWQSIAICTGATTLIHAEHIIAKHPRPKLRKGYTWSEPRVYSGKIA